MSWQKIIGNIAPTIATALGGPLAGMAAKEVTDALGLTDKATDNDILKALQDPESLVKLKTREIDFKQRSEELGVDYERIASEDRNSARNRQIQTKDNIPNYLAFVVIVGFFTTIGYVFSGRIGMTGEQGIMVGTIVGYVSAKADQVLSYFFGSSNGSKQKNQLLSDMAKK